MALKDKIISVPEIQSLIKCNMNMSRQFKNDSWTGTLEQACDYARTDGSVDYFNAIWIAMQYFAPHINRSIAFQCVAEAAGMLNYELPWSNLLIDRINSTVTDDVRQEQYNNLYEVYRATKDTYGTPAQQLVAKSAINILHPDHAKYCPTVLYSVRPIIGEPYIDNLVRETIRNHP